MIEDQYLFRVCGVWDLNIKPTLKETSEISSSFPIRLQRYFQTKTQYHEFFGHLPILSYFCYVALHDLVMALKDKRGLEVLASAQISKQDKNNPRLPEHVREPHFIIRPHLSEGHLSKENV